MKASVSLNYAQALFSLLSKEESFSYKVALEEIETLLEENLDLRKFLTSYNVGKNEANQIIQEISKSYKLSYLNSFLCLIHDKHRFNIFKDISRDFSHLVNESNGVSEGIIYSVNKLDSKEIKEIKESLEKLIKNKVELSNILDPSLIGGIKVSINGRVYDNSIKAQLEDLKKDLRKGGKTL